ESLVEWAFPARGKGCGWGGSNSHGVSASRLTADRVYQLRHTRPNLPDHRRSPASGADASGASYAISQNVKFRLNSGQEAGISLPVLEHIGLQQHWYRLTASHELADSCFRTEVSSNGKTRKEEQGCPPCVVPHVRGGARRLHGSR